MLLSSTDTEAPSTAICLCAKVACYASQGCHCWRAQSWCETWGGRDVEEARPIQAWGAGFGARVGEELVAGIRE